MDGLKGISYKMSVSKHNPGQTPGMSRGACLPACCVAETGLGEGVGVCNGLWLPDDDGKRGPGGLTLSGTQTATLATILHFTVRSLILSLRRVR